MAGMKKKRKQQQPAKPMVPKTTDATVPMTTDVLPVTPEDPQPIPLPESWNQDESRV